MLLALQLGMKIVIVIGIIAASFTISMFLLHHFSVKKLIKKVENMQKDIEEDNKAQFDVYLKRLSNIADKNDSYRDIHSMMLNQYNKLFKTDKELLLDRQHALYVKVKTNKHTPELKNEVSTLNITILQFHKDCDRLYLKLKDIFMAGDKLRLHANDLKIKYKNIKSDLEKYHNSLETCLDNLNDYVSEIGISFELFEGNMESAKYEEAQQKLDDIEGRIFNVFGNIETIAQYNNMVVSIIPKQLEDLENKNKDLEESGYVVAHAKVNEFVANTKEVLDSCVTQFRHLYFADFKEISLEIQNKLTDVHTRLDYEVSSKIEFDAKYKIVNDKIKIEESEFIKTKRKYTSMCEYYLLPQEMIDRFQSFEKNATLLSDLKREFDGYIFVNTKNPASFMLEKVQIMDDLANNVNADMTYLNNYFLEVKNTVEKIFIQVDELSSTLITSLGKIRFNKCFPVYDKYRSTVDTCLGDLKNINALLMEKPINITYINDLFGPLMIRVDETRKKMLNEMTNYMTVERSILFANPLRCQFNEVDKLLKDAEENFTLGDYKSAQDKINYVLNNFHINAYDVFNKE